LTVKLFLQTEQVDQAIECLKTGIKLFHQVAVPPHEDLHYAQESLRACIATNGNTFKAI
jgi:SET and MYND domain-containing protein 4